MPHRNVYVEKMKVQLEELTSAIEKLDGAMQVGEVQAMTAAQIEVRKLRLLSQNALAKLEEIRAAGDDSWESLRVESDKIRDALVYSFHQFKSQV